MFHVNIAKFLRTAFFINHLRWLLLNKVKANLKSPWFIFITWLTIPRYKSIKTLNSNHSAKQQRYKNTKKQKHEKIKHRRTKTKWTSRKCRLLETRIEQNNDHTGIIHKIQFCRSFKGLIRSDIVVWELHFTVLNSEDAELNLILLKNLNYRILRG